MDFDEMKDQEDVQVDEIDMAESAISASPQAVISSFVNHRFQLAKDSKRPDEARGLRAYQNYRGIWTSDDAMNTKEKSKVFIKITKTKVQAGYGGIIDVILGNGNFPITVDPTSLPEGVEESVYYDPKAPPGSPVFTRDGPELPPGSTSLNLGGMKEKLDPIADKLQKGQGTTETSMTFHPALVAAKKMEKQIHDDLEESNASFHLRKAVFECALLGTGIIKGPFAVEKEYAKWSDDGTYEPVKKIVPQISHVSFWNYYPDPDAQNSDDLSWNIERHKKSRSGLNAFKKFKNFNAEAVETAKSLGPNYLEEYWETTMRDGSSNSPIDRYEVLEYWGDINEEVWEAALSIDKSLKDKLPEDFEIDDLKVNIFICHDQILKFVINPFKPVKNPYLAFPYEDNPYSFFGVGIGENMEDTQQLMNGFMRLGVDNAVLSGNVVFEIDEDSLVPGQDLEMYPGKVIRRQGGVPGQAVFVHNWPNITQQNMLMFDKARLLADESTGITSYSHGQAGVQGLGRTSSGISMFMNAAAGVTRTVVKNIDDYLLKKLGKNLFDFNMQFNPDIEIKGDLEIKARGTDSYMMSEVKSQRLMQFLGIVSNPILAPFAKLDVILREIADSLELDPDKITNNMDEAKLQAEVMSSMNPQGGKGEGGDPSGMGGTSPNDTQGSGGGTIGTGSVPLPGEQGFSNNTGQGEA